VTVATDSTALLVMDFQRAIVDRLGDDHLIARAGRAAQAARAAGTAVIFVRVAFRDGYPEVAASNRTFSALVSRGGFTEDSPETQIDPRLGPQGSDLVVTKRRVSAFSGSDLGEVLRARRVGTLVLSGISTSGVVLSTLRQAADLDFELIVLRDACADPDAEVHRVLTEKVFPRQAEVMTVADWVAR
jgi:nicotinamidase-related amidase